MIEVYTDAAASGDPGPSAAGVILKQGKQLMEYSFYLGEKSNHEAEFLAVIKALETCREHYPEEILSIRSDAKVVVDTIEKGFTKNAKFSEFLNLIQELEQTFPYVFYKWIPEKQNKNADRLARSELLKYTKPS